MADKVPLRKQHMLSGEELDANVEEQLATAQAEPVKEYPVSLAGVYKKIANLKLPMPTYVEHDDKYDWPLAITRVSNERVRDLHSYYTAQFGYCQTTIADIEFTIDKAEDEIRKRTRALRAANIGRKVAEVSAIIEDDKKIIRLGNTKTHATGLLKHLQALSRAFEKYIFSASRELSARESEMRHLNARSQ